MVKVAVAGRGWVAVAVGVAWGRPKKGEEPPGGGSISALAPKRVVQIPPYARRLGRGEESGVRPRVDFGVKLEVDPAAV